jgi:hypothetical protein
MGCPEHQIRLSKGVIAKFVQLLDLGSAIQADAPAARAAGFRSVVAHACICRDLTPISLQDVGHPFRKKSHRNGGFCFLY